MNNLKYYLLAFCGLCFPLRLLLAIDALTKLETPADIALQAWLSLGFAFAIAVITCGAISALLSLIRLWPTLQRRVDFGHIVVTGGISFLIVTLSFKRWFFEVFHYTGGFSLTGKLILLGASCVVALALIQRFGIAGLTIKIRTLLDRMMWPVATIVACTMSILSVMLIATPLSRDLGTLRHDIEPQPLSPAQRPNIILITLDAFSAGSSELWGNAHITTPNLSRIAASGVVFDQFYASGNMTTPTTSSMETGTYTWTHRAFQLDGFVQSEPQDRSFAQALKAIGYETAHFGANWYANPAHKALGSGWTHTSRQLFDLPWYVFDINTRLGGRMCADLAACDLTRMRHLFPFAEIETLIYPLWQATGDYDAEWATPRILNTQIESFLSHRNSPDQPLFLWAHMFPPHDPYAAEAPFLGKFLAGTDYAKRTDYAKIIQGELGTLSPEAQRKLRLRYEENLLGADHYLNVLLQTLDRHGYLKNSVVMISTDHGESFSRGYFGHCGPLLSQELIRIPMVVLAPDAKPQRITTIASQIDLAPTVLDFAGVSAPASMTGRSLKPEIVGSAVLPSRPVYAMNFENSSAYAKIQKGSVAVIDGQWKFIKYLDNAQGLQDTLHNLVTDSAETTNLIAEFPDIHRQMDALISAKLNEANTQYKGRHP